MARSGIQEVLSVLDPLQTWNFSVQINLPPGIGDSRELIYKCTGSAIPGSQIEQAAVEAHGVKMNYAGRRTWSGTWNVTFFESRSASTRDLLLSWMEFARSWRLNAGSYKSQYATTALITLYDDLPQAVREVEVFGVWPTSMDDVTLDQSSQVMAYNMTFSYDYANN